MSGIPGRPHCDGRGIAGQPNSTGACAPPFFIFARVPPGGAAFEATEPTMRLNNHPASGFMAAILLAVVTILPVAHGEQVLATVGGDYPITMADLQRTIGSSPFATQFNTMDADNQAVLRANFLKRLVNARLLLLEAEQMKLDQDPAFVEDMRQLHNSLLRRAYMKALREEVKIPPATLAAMETQLEDEPDALQATNSAWRADAYRELKLERLQQLREQYHVVIHEDKLQPGQPADTVIASGDGINIEYSDLTAAADNTVVSNPEWLRQQLVAQLRLALLVRAAEDAGIDVEQQLGEYRNERLPALLLTRKEADWAGDEKVLESWFSAHPEVGVIPERRHIGQLVVAERELADELRQRILKGESLFTLAEQYSIDPYGQSHKGDMGWLKQGSGLPAIEQAITKLPDNQVSEVIETPRGFHLVTIVGRRPGGTRDFPSVRDRVRNMVILEQLTPYLREIEDRYGVEWKVFGPATAQVK